MLQYLLLIPPSLALYYYIRVERRVAALKALNPGKKLRIYRFYLPFKNILVRLNLFPSSLSWLIYDGLPGRWHMEPEAFPYDDDEIVFVCSTAATTPYIASDKLIHEMIDRKTEFVKPVHVYDLLNVFGHNVVTLNGDDWKRHRKIAAPNFSEKNNELVYKETLRAISLMDEEWKKEGLKEPKDLSFATFNIALNVISGAAFGVSLPWNEDVSEAKRSKRGRVNTFKTALSRMVESLPKYILIPKSLFKLNLFSSLRKMEEDIVEFDSWMKTLIDDGKAGKLNSSNNLLSAMIANTSDEANESTISERELIGNIFIFLFAGHETTAGTLGFAFSFLALFPEMQERLFQEITEVCGKEELQFANLQAMPYALSVMYETLRLKPAVCTIPKYVVQDTRLGDYVIPAECIVDLHVYGAQMSSKKWGSTVGEFNPGRWFTDAECGSSAKACLEKSKNEGFLKGFLHQNRYSFIPFSDGPRSCIGKRFAEVEFMTCIISIIQKYSLHVPEGVSSTDLLMGNELITFKSKNPVKLIVKRRS